MYLTKQKNTYEHLYTTAYEQVRHDTDFQKPGEKSASIIFLKPVIALGVSDDDEDSFQHPACRHSALVD